MVNQEQIERLLEWAWRAATSGLNFGQGLPKGLQDWLPNMSCEALAEEYLKKYPTVHEAVAAFIKWQCTHAGVVGVAAGMPGLMVSLAALPAQLAWVTFLQLRMVATIACMHGWDPNSSQTKTVSFIALLGAQAASFIAVLGSQIAMKLAANVVGLVPGKILIEINKALGMRLLTKVGETGMIRLIGVVPLIGGLTTGGLNAYATYHIGWAADGIFKQGGAGVGGAIPPGAEPDAETEEGGESDRQGE